MSFQDECKLVIPRRLVSYRKVPRHIVGLPAIPWSNVMGQKNTKNPSVLEVTNQLRKSGSVEKREVENQASGPKPHQLQRN